MRSLNRVRMYCRLESTRTLDVMLANSSTHCGGRGEGGGGRGEGEEVWGGGVGMEGTRVSERVDIPYSLVLKRMPIWKQQEMSA